MNEPPVKRTSFFTRLKSLPLRTWATILAVETIVLVILLVVFIVVLFR